MGYVGKDAKGSEETKAAKDDEPEDSPLVKQLKEIDDKYLALEKEYERECQKLIKQFAEKQQPLLDERKALLTATEENSPKTGTPALDGFWLKALQNHPGLEDNLQEWDLPVLEYLSDIEKEHLEETDDGVRGFALKFHFVENPYFTNTMLRKEYKMATANPYIGEVEVKEINCTTIDWKAGKDVTIAKVAPKKVKGGGAKKAKQKKEKEEPRPSFFRDFFRNLHPKMKLTSDAKEHAMCLAEEEGDDGEDSDDEENLLAYLMESDHEIGAALRDNIIPFAVRWYTGEAAPELDFEEDDEDEEEEDEEEDEEDDDSEDEMPRGKGRGKAARGPGRGGAAQPAKTKPKGKAKASPEIKPADGKQEECKQQ